jgi:hypothetical protein
MHFLRDLGADPAKTAHFDQSMSRLYLVLTLGLCLFAGWTMLATS